MRTTDNAPANPVPLCVSVSPRHIHQPAKARQTTPSNQKVQNEPTAPIAPTAPQEPTRRHNPRPPCGTKPPAKTTVTECYNLLQLFNSHSVRASPRPICLTSDAEEGA